MKRIYIFISIILGMGIISSCDEFFKQESDDVLYADQEHLDNAVDSVWSVTGILKKLQALGDRTVLLGEVRGDLVKLTESASSDLRELSNFEVGDDNRYNDPSAYYAVINNCNYFITHADTAMRSNRNEIIFMKEYAAVKAIRAWTYLQLAINYGQVPFVTEPLFSKEEAEAAEQGAKADIQTVCSYFINDLANIPERYNNEFPGFGNINSTPSVLLFFPLSLVRGDLYLWRASVTGSKEDYRQAALCYFKFISERNGMNSIYPLRVGDKVYFDPRATGYQSYSGGIFPFSETANPEQDPEIITMIASDEKRADGNYSELRNLFCSTDDNQRKVSISPSERADEISSAQVYCMVPETGTSVFYPNQQLPDHMTGDLRLADTWTEDYERDRYTQEMTETQYITKYAGRGDRGVNNIHIYRRTMVYLRLAEALNMAGYPRMAFKILSEGLNNTVIQYDVMPYYDSESKSDSIFLSQFDFNPVRYQLVTIDDFRGNSTGATSNHNMMGIHSRGSGWTPLNEFYQLPEADIPEIEETDDEDGEEELDDFDLFLKDTPELIARQQAFVDSLILNESALEFAFEGTRYYDIMRYALHQSNPGQAMAKIIGARLGEANRGSMAAIAAKLANQHNWFLNWKGKIGY